MDVEPSRAVEIPWPEHVVSDLGTEETEANTLVRSLRRSAKRRRRTAAWIVPLITVGMAATVLVFSRVDIRLSLTIFGVSAAIVAMVLFREAAQWERLAGRAAVLSDVRAIGPLLTVLNDRDSSACETIEEALIELLPRIERLNQLSRTARTELNRLLLEFEMPGLRGGHNADLARAALEVVARFRDCSALPAVRRLAEGFTATRPSAEIRDLATDILPDLEERAALLRPSRAAEEPEHAYLRPAHSQSLGRTSDDLLRSVSSSGRGELPALADERAAAVAELDPLKSLGQA
jgi:hypothetical protein